MSMSGQAVDIEPFLKAFTSNTERTTSSLIFRKAKLEKWACWQGLLPAFASPTPSS